MSLKPWKESGDKLDDEDDLGVFISRSLSILFESSDILEAKLVPNVVAIARAAVQWGGPKSYSDLIHLSLGEIRTWDDVERAAFISGHPRIGEVRGLSELSAAEQAAKATSPEVLARLEALNAQYEKMFPGLRYITFVRGRSRAEIVPEMEGVLAGYGYGYGVGEGGDGGVVGGIYLPGTEEWIKELDRAIKDVGLIAKARLENMGLE